MSKSQREQLAAEVQAEALRPSPQAVVRPMEERLAEAARRIRELEEIIEHLKEHSRKNARAFLKEQDHQRRELFAMEQRRQRLAA